MARGLVTRCVAKQIRRVCNQSKPFNSELQEETILVRKKFDFYYKERTAKTDLQFSKPLFEWPIHCFFLHCGKFRLKDNEYWSTVGTIPLEILYGLKEDFVKILGLNPNGSEGLVDAQLLISRTGFSQLTGHKITNRGKNPQKRTRLLKFGTENFEHHVLLYKCAKHWNSDKEIFVFRAHYCLELGHDDVNVPNIRYYCEFQNNYIICCQSLIRTS